MSISMSEKLKLLIGYLARYSTKVNLTELHVLLEKLAVTRRDLLPYLKFNDDHYERNLVSSSDNYELLVMCWRGGQKSQIHDHHGSSCAFRVIEGMGRESCFTETAPGLVRLSHDVMLPKGSVCVSEQSHIHQVSNDSREGEFITLHIYSPPLHMRVYKIDPSLVQTKKIVTRK